ncbi:MAG: stage II sporulation protein M [Clostridia bacterium]|nr:stage II sporulation protein M [Clostridia bacterium]
MRVNSSGGERNSLVVVILIVFAVGLILGILSLFRMPVEITEETKDVIATALLERGSLREVIISNCTAELVWLSAIWILGTLSVMAPFIAAIVAMRGFILGFSSAFILSEITSAEVKTLCAYIVPQCVFSLPLMTLFSVLCIKSCVERKSGETTDAKYFLLGLICAPLCVAFSVIEALISSLLLG